MKYLRKFASDAEYAAFKNSDSYVTPNVVLVNGKVDYNPVIYPLYIEARESLNVSFSNTYEYSKDNKTWTSGTSSTSISANAGERVFFRASGLAASFSSGIGKFTISNGNCNVGGNVMSMVYGADFVDKTEVVNNNQFTSMFKGCTNVIDASKLLLPATTLTENCYTNMFYGCTSLVNPPALPATTLAQYCYNNMFQGCTSLVNAPALPATTLASDCYSVMFKGCTSLVSAPTLPATTLADYCYQYMFSGCTSLVNAPALPATTLASNCYGNMFAGCTSLVKAPALHATTLNSKCYNNIFKGCSKLNYIKAMFTTSPSTNYMENWVSGVSASGTFVKNSAATWENSFGTSGIPSGWTVELADA